MPNSRAKRWKANGWIRNRKEKADNTEQWDNLLDCCVIHCVAFIWPPVTRRTGKIV